MKHIGQLSALRPTHPGELLGEEVLPGAGFNQMQLAKAQRRLLDERLADEENDPDDVEPWTKAKDDILRDL